jgi:acetyl esterase/lipase
MSAENRVTPNTPPTFIYHPVSDATVPIENALLYVDALRRAGVSFEFHAIAGGRHGMGLAASDPAQGQWPAMCAQWLASCGWR